MKKRKYVKIRKENILQLLNTYRFASQSIQDGSIIIKQYNSLTLNQREKIVKEYTEKEEILKKQITTPKENLFFICSMVSLNIIASKFDIDPATVCMCISPICKLSENIMII